MHPIQCKCGALRGHVKNKGISNRIICYCTDCRAFAKYLGCADDVLDAHDGTEIVQVAQARLTITHGTEHLAAIRLSDKGMVRWYAACCNTPIGNTMVNPKISFIGVIHSSLKRSSLDTDFGNNVALLNTATANREPKPIQKGLIGAIARLLWIVFITRIGGQYRKSPLFKESGAPIVQPVVLSAEELERLKRDE